MKCPYCEEEFRTIGDVKEHVFDEYCEVFVPTYHSNREKIVAEIIEINK